MSLEKERLKIANMLSIKLSVDGISYSLELDHPDLAGTLIFPLANKGMQGLLLGKYMEKIASVRAHGDNK